MALPASRISATVLAVFMGLLLGACASPAGKAPPTRAPGFVRQLTTEDRQIQQICRSLEQDSASTALSTQAKTAIAWEHTRDTCRLARALAPDAKLELPSTTDDIGALQEATSRCLTAIDSNANALGGSLGQLEAHEIAAHFDLSLVVAIKLIELGERTSNMVERMSKSFGRLSGMVQISLETLIAELTALSLEQVLEHPEVRKFAGPTEIARESCRLWKAAEPRPHVTQRLLERSILRLAHSETNRQSLDGACEEDPSRPGCKPLKAAVEPGTDHASIETVCETTRWPHMRRHCRRLGETITASKAHPLDELCARTDDGASASAVDPAEALPRRCTSLAAQALKKGTTIDELCEKTSVPHMRWQCRDLVQEFASLGRWHPSEAENSCRAQPRRCARYRDQLLERAEQDKPLDPNPELSLSSVVVDEQFDQDVAQCINAALEPCHRHEGGEVEGASPQSEDLLLCIADRCSIALSRRSEGDEQLAFGVLVEELGEVRYGLGLLHDDMGRLSASMQRVEQGVDTIGSNTKVIGSDVHDFPQSVGAAVSNALNEAGLVKNQEFEKAVADLVQRLDELESVEKDLLGLAGQLERELAAKNLDVGIRVQGDHLGLEIPSQVLFESSKASVSRKGKERVCALAEVLNVVIDELKVSNRDFSVDIIGNASPISNSPSETRGLTNMGFSSQRAVAIYDLLTENQEKTAGQCKDGRRRQDCKKCEHLINEQNVQVMVVGRGDNGFTSGLPKDGRTVVIEFSVARSTP